MYHNVPLVCLAMLLFLVVKKSGNLTTMGFELPKKETHGNSSNTDLMIFPFLEKHLSYFCSYTFQKGNDVLLSS